MQPELEGQDPGDMEMHRSESDPLSGIPVRHWIFHQPYIRN